MAFRCKSRIGRTCIHADRLSVDPLLLGAEEVEAARRASTRLTPRLIKTYERLGIPLHEQKILAGVAVDAIFDSVSVGTTMKEELAKPGIIFCSLGEAIREHPELVEKYLGSVVPYSDNFFAALNSAVFSDGSFVYVPKGVRCPMELSTYFRINAADTGQFERTLIVADEGAYVSYLEGCTAPSATRISCMRRSSSSSRSTVRRSSTRPCRTGTPATRKAAAASITSSPSAERRVRMPRSPGRRSRPDRRSRGSIRV